MANIRVIRRRIRSVRSTAKITRAMELVAASKMRRAQARALQTRPYAEKLREVLAHLAAAAGDEEALEHPFLRARPVERILAVHMTPDRGLCGGLNANMNRRAAAFALEQPVPVSFLTVGKKGRDFFLRTGQHIVAEFTQLGDYPESVDTLPIAQIAMEEYLEGRADRVYIIYPMFVNTVTQRPTVLQLLPVEPPEAAPDAAARAVEYLYEPGPSAVLASILPRYVEMLVFEAVLETAASEQSARMVAMRNATDAANEMIETLTLVYNKARQEQITKELLDIVGGVAALEKR